MRAALVPGAQVAQQQRPGEHPELMGRGAGLGGQGGRLLHHLGQLPLKPGHLLGRIPGDLPNPGGLLLAGLLRLGTGGLGLFPPGL
jgi:hypothetical protein